jgi:hypothetical protein
LLEPDGKEASLNRSSKVHNLSVGPRCSDAKREGSSCKALLQGGSVLMVPCLQIEDVQGTVSWMDDASEIIDYLKSRLMAQTSPV